MRLNGKTALITGGSSGIGLTSARLMVAEGAQVAITGRDAAKLEAAVTELGDAAIGVVADTAIPSEIDAMVERCRSAFGTLDIVFANAGISGASPLGQTTAESFASVLAVNLTGVFLTVQAALPLMGQGGSIVLNGSVLREVGFPGGAAYAASKGGVSAMARVFAAELAPRGIRCNTVIPGATDTPIWTRGGRSVNAMTKAIQRSIPIGRFATAEEVGRAVLFLASDESSGMTAAEIVVDGGTIGAPYGAPAYRA